MDEEVNEISKIMCQQIENVNKEKNHEKKVKEILEMKGIILEILKKSIGLPWWCSG